MVECPTYNLQSVRAHERSKLIAYVQETPVLLEFLSARQTLEYCVRLYAGWRCDDLDEHVDGILDRLHLMDRTADKPIHLLNAREKVLVHIGTHLYHAPTILMLEAPFKSLSIRDAIRVLRYSRPCPCPRSSPLQRAKGNSCSLRWTTSRSCTRDARSSLVHA